MFSPRHHLFNNTAKKSNSLQVSHSFGKIIGCWVMVLVCLLSAIGMTFATSTGAAQASMKTPGAPVGVSLPAVISVVSGNLQKVSVNNVLGTALKVKVSDGLNNPVSGASVTFQTPALVAGLAGGTFAGGANSVTVTTDNNGLATAPTFTANASLGAYVVNATTPGVVLPAIFAITNIAGVPAIVSSIEGTPQNLNINSPLAIPLKAKVVDAVGNPLSDIQVVFQVPVLAGAAGGTFTGGATTVTVTTDVSGTATAPNFIANGNLGSYTINAKVNGIIAPAAFLLTNVPVQQVCNNPYLVNLNLDDGAGITCGSLSLAITKAAISTTPITITFSTPVITVTAPLPGIVNIHNQLITLDGGCQLASDGSGRGIPGTKMVAAGSTAMSAGGLSQVAGMSLSSSTKLRGMSITGFSGYAIDIQGSGNQVSCTWLGTNDGVTAAPNGGGIRLGTAGVGGIMANNNILGEVANPQSGNLISGNAGYGILVNAGTNNQSYYNWIGYKKDGTSILKNSTWGISVKVGAQLKFGLGNRTHN